MLGTATASAVHNDNLAKLCTWTRVLWAPKTLKWKRASRQTLDSVSCHHFVTCRGHPFRYWPCLFQLSERLPHRQRSMHSQFATRNSRVQCWTLKNKQLTCIYQTLLKLILASIFIAKHRNFHIENKNTTIHQSLYYQWLRFFGFFREKYFGHF
jgi:hypothetical protein